MVIWEPAEGATGYTVYRADAAGGPFTAAASIDATTGAVTIRYGGGYEYMVIVQGIQTPTAFEYVEAIRGAFGYFRVAAYNSGGEGPLSGLVCSEAETGAEPQPTTNC